MGTKLLTSKDSSPKRESEERSSPREAELTPGNPPKKLTSPTRSSSPNILRRRKLPRKPLNQLQSQSKLLQLKLQPRLRRNQLLQLKKLQKPKRTRRKERERSEM